MMADTKSLFHGKISTLFYQTITNWVWKGFKVYYAAFDKIRRFFKNTTPSFRIIYANGLIEDVDDPESIGIVKVHYLPHHAVIWQDKETTKLRIVYDASAKSKGPSLNDCLYTGPKFDQRIMDIWLRFHTHQVALTADIEKAFLMVSKSEKDRDVLWFL